MNDETVHSITIGPGAVIDTTMSPQERAAVVAKYHGVEIPSKPSGGIPFGPRHEDGRQAHTDETMATLNQRDAVADKPAKAPAAKAAPAVPTPKEQADKVAGFDAEMRAKGIQTGTAAPAAPPGPNIPYQTALTNLYRETVLKFEESLKVVKTPAARAKVEAGLADFRQKWTKEFAYANDGGHHASFPATSAEAPATPSVGRTPAAAIGAEHRHGYTLPADWSFTDVPKLAAGLKLAREYGWSQAQVDKILADTELK